IGNHRRHRGHFTDPLRAFATDILSIPHYENMRISPLVFHNGALSRRFFISVMRSAVMRKNYTVQHREYDHNSQHQPECSLQSHLHLQRNLNNYYLFPRHLNTSSNACELIACPNYGTTVTLPSIPYMP